MESEGEEEEHEDNPMLHPRERQNEGPKLNNCDKRKLFRQQTISNPGYQMLMKRLNSSKKGSKDIKEVAEKSSKQNHSLKPAQSPNNNDPTPSTVTYLGINSISSGYSTWSDSQPSSRSFLDYSTSSGANTPTNLYA